MPVTVSERELPEAKIHRAVCAEVSYFKKETKDRKGNTRMSEMIAFSFELEALQKNGKRFIVGYGAEFFTDLTPDNNFGKFLQSWSGSGDKLSKEQLQEWARRIDGGQMVGGNCNLLIVHQTSKSSGRINAIIDKIMPKTEGLPRLEVSADYVNRETRLTPRDQQAPAGQVSQSAPIKEDDPVPF